jgi:prophage antirepressor-like protein
VLNDLCRILNIANPRDVAARLDPLTLSQTEVQNARGQMRLTVIVSESGMHEVIIRSDSPKAPAGPNGWGHEVG